MSEQPLQFRTVAHTVDLGIPGIGPARALARGGSANVYLAEQLDFGRDVAVKVLFDAPDSEADYRRFDRECRAVGAVSHHPNIVVVHGRGLTEAGLPYLVMEHRSGGSLADRLAIRGRLTEAEVVRIGQTMANALAVAHAAGVLHRDIKPGNIMLSAYDEPALGDFGIARMEGGHKTTQGMFSASVAHASREVLDNGEPTPSSDIYSLASTLFELVTGRPPFVHKGDETVWAVVDRVLNQDAPDLRSFGVSPELAGVIGRSLAHDPAARHPSATDLASDLKELAAPGSNTSRPQAAAEATLVDAMAPAVGPDPALAAAPSAGNQPAPARSGGPPPAAPRSAQPRVAAPPRDGSTVLVYVFAAFIFLAASAGGIFLLSRLSGPTDDTATEDTEDTAIDDAALDETEAAEAGESSGDDEVEDPAGADAATANSGAPVDSRFAFRLPSAAIGPLSAGERYPVELSPADVEDATYRLVIDGEPEGVAQDGLPVYFAAEGRHTIQLEIETIDGVVATEGVEVYVTGPGPEKGYRANLAAVRSEPGTWPAVLAAFDRLVADGHDELKLNLSTREEAEGLPFWNLYVDGFGDDLDAGRAYCDGFGLSSDECFVALVD